MKMAVIVRDMLLGLLVMLCVGLTTPSAACPDVCSCNDGLTACIGKNLTEIPADIPADTTQLYLKHLRISTLKAAALSSLVTLETLVATDCEIEVIEPEAFSGLVKLASLDLSSNKIKQLGRKAFAGAPKLRTLTLDSNDIEIIDNSAFHGLNLTRLRLEKNENLREISPDAFTGARVQQLRISHTALSSQSAHALSPLKSSLRELSWEYNSRPLSLPADIFAGFRFKRLNLIDVGIRDSSFLAHVSAEDLSLVGNAIGVVDFSQYPSLKHVRTLSLDNTGFSSPDGRHFADMTHLSQLLLANNGITSLPENLRAVFDLVGILKLGENSFHCNCELWWFKEWATLNSDKVTGARCATNVEGDMVMIKNKAEFLCTPPTTPKVSQDLTTSGDVSHVTLTCTSTGDPAPTIVWEGEEGEQLSRSPPSYNRTLVANRGIVPLQGDVTSETPVKRTCRAVNIAGNSSLTTTVDVYKVLQDREHSKDNPTGAATSHTAYTWTVLLTVMLLLRATSH